MTSLYGTSHNQKPFIGPRQKRELPRIDVSPFRDHRSQLFLTQFLELRGYGPIPCSLAGGETRGGGSFHKYFPMSSAKELTGGTGDVNPQYLSVTVTQTSVNSTTTAEVPLPIPRVALKKGRAIVLEVLKVLYDQFNITTAATGTGDSHVYALIGTSPTNTEVTDREVFDFDHTEINSIAGLPAALFHITTNTHVHDLSDGAGHGLLIASPALYFTIRSFESAILNAVQFKVFYRFKEVALEEYLGIVSVQS